MITVHCRGKWRMKLRGGLELRLSTTARESVISIRFWWWGGVKASPPSTI
jgi:hypothetical protein